MSGPLGSASSSPGRTRFGTQLGRRGGAVRERLRLHRQRQFARPTQSRSAHPTEPSPTAMIARRCSPPAMTVVDTTTFYFQFAGTLNTAVGIIAVPYEDMQVQNFQS